MPLTQDSNRVEAPQGKDFQLIPEDVYQAVIVDVDEKVMKKFQSEEEEVFYQFKMKLLEGPAEVLGQPMSVFCTRKWFSGNSKASPSKLVKFVKAIYAYYYPKLSVIELEADDMTPQVINDLIGKQLRISVKVDERTDGSGQINKISDFMSVRKELELPEGIKVELPKEVAKPGEVKDNEKGEEESEDSKMPF